MAGQLLSWLGSWKSPWPSFHPQSCCSASLKSFTTLTSLFFFFSPDLRDPNSPARDRTWALGRESTESQPLDHWRIPSTSPSDGWPACDTALSTLPFAQTAFFPSLAVYESGKSEVSGKSKRKRRKWWQSILWPNIFRPSAILLSVLEQGGSEEQKQDSRGRREGGSRGRGHVYGYGRFMLMYGTPVQSLSRVCL